MKCDRCNEIMETNWKFCPYCGNLLKKALNIFIDPRDGECYKIVTIGTQTWMAENLRYKCDGAHAYKNDLSFIREYGLLYNRNASRIVAPKGWHLPSLNEFEKLVKFVKDENLLKKSYGWEKSYKDSFGFGALPAGYGAQGGDFRLGKFTSYWTSSGNDFYHQGSFFEMGTFDYDELGDSFVDSVSIRLVKDE